MKLERRESMEQKVEPKSKNKKKVDLFAESSEDDDQIKDANDDDNGVDIEPALVKNMADQEGYYQPKTDEVLNQRYKVMDVAGKGVFSCVVRARDMTV
jgi:serine/threonine-protein kinase PRP4